MRLMSGMTCLLFLASPLHLSAAQIRVEYFVDVGGGYPDPLNGLSAAATFDIQDVHLTILLENTSTGVPDGFETSDALLVSLGMNLTDIEILSGEAALIAPGSIGLGAWSLLGEGDSVAEEWLWTNDGGGDFMSDYAQVISTSSGQGGGLRTRFDGVAGNVNGPFGGIAAGGIASSVPAHRPAVRDAIVFQLTLTAPLAEFELRQIVRESIVEFGSDQRYLGTPEPGSLSLLAVAGAAGLIRRRRT